MSSVSVRMAIAPSSAGEVDHDVASIDLATPLAEGFPVPSDDTPWTRAWMAAQDGHIMAVLQERTAEDRSDLSRPARQDDFHSQAARG